MSPRRGRSILRESPVLQSDWPLLFYDVGNEFSVAGHWSGEFDEAALQRWTEDLRSQLSAPAVSLGLVFMAPPFFPRASQILEILRVHARVPLLAGCSSQSLIVGDARNGGERGIDARSVSLAGRRVEAFHFTQEQVEEANGPGYWRLETGIEPAANQRLAGVYRPLSPG